MESPVAGGREGGPGGATGFSGALGDSTVGYIQCKICSLLGQTPLSTLRTCPYPSATHMSIIQNRSSLLYKKPRV